MSDEKQDELHEHAKLLRAALEEHNISKTYYADWVGISRPTLNKMLELKKMTDQGQPNKGFSRTNLLLASLYFGLNYFKLPASFFDRKLLYSENYTEPDRIVMLAGAGFSNQWVKKELESIPHALKGRDIKEQERPIVDAIEDIAASLNRSKDYKNSHSRDLLNQLHYYWRLSKSIELDPVIKSNSHKKVLSHEAKAASDFWKNSLLYCINILQEYYGVENLKSLSDNVSPRGSSLSIQDLEQVLSNICSVSGNDRIFVYLANYYCPLQILANDTLIGANFYTLFNKEGKFTSKWFSTTKKEGAPNIYFTSLFGSIKWKLNEDKSLEQLSTGKMMNDGKGSKIERLGIAVKTMQQTEPSIAFSSIMEGFNTKVLSCQTLLFWGHNLNDRLLLFRVLALWFRRKHNPFKIIFIDTEYSEYIGNQSLEKKFLAFEESFGIPPSERKKNLDLFRKNISWIDSSILRDGKIPMKWYR